MIRKLAVIFISCGLALASSSPWVLASSHREAPLITSLPKVDGTDFYMFNSYEPGRAGFVTMVANYQPFEASWGGPNYYTMDPNALYEIEIDNVGDGNEHLTFQFQFTNTGQNIQLNVGGTNVAVPVINVGPISGPQSPNLNVVETFTVNLVRGNRRTGQMSAVTNAANGATIFSKPVDNIGQKTIANYNAYAQQFTYNINIPGCSTPGRMFVGQRADPFVVNLGETFDLINIPHPISATNESDNVEPNTLQYQNVTSLILEVAASCLVSSSTQPVIGGWTTASLRQASVLNPNPIAGKPATVVGGAWTQVSRLGSPLVNELVIGLKDKDNFNASAPANDAQFASYVTNPTLPAIIQALFGSAKPACSPNGIQAPTLFPRADLVAAFLNGISGLNANGSTAEMLRLNTSTTPTPQAQQNRLGVIGGDNSGFPNGRRPGDDVVDIALRVVMGRLISLGMFGTPSQAPSGTCNFTDGALVNASFFTNAFPYIQPPTPGSPNGPNGIMPIITGGAM